MSTSADLQNRWLLFTKLDHLAGFLLTCLEEPTCSPGSDLFDRQLNKLQYATKLRRIFVAVQGPAAQMQLIASIAIANSGRVLNELPKDQGEIRKLTLQQFLQSVLLEPRQHDHRTDQILAAFHGIQSEQLAPFLETVGQLGVRHTEVAFITSGGGSRYTHLVRMRGIQDWKAFVAIAGASKVKIDLFVPLRSERSTARFYVKLGHRFPIPSLDRLARLSSELVLLQPARGDVPGTEWICFGAGEANFFRRMAECVDLTLADDQLGMVELREDPTPRNVPLELALAPRPHGPPMQLVEVDRQIDRQQRLLSELNRSRERLVSSDTDEVYFAYCFDQPEGDPLNSSLTAFLQQRVSTLRNCSYAYCEPRQERHPFHLVIARRSQKYEGFSLQVADRVFFQPAAWRQAEVPLYLPWGMELAPRIDSRDAVELLHRFFEETEPNLESDAPPPEECAAVLWEGGRRGEIYETRVRSLSGLLDQFQIFNEFRRETAAEIAKTTRSQLEEGLQQARVRIDGQLDELTKELYEHVAQRTTQIETNFDKMVEQLAAAMTLVNQVQADAKQVTQLVETIPEDWVSFVSKVIEVHREVSKPSYVAYQDLKARLKPTADDLRTLALRGRNLAELAVRQRQRLEERIEQCNQMVAQTDNSREVLEAFAPRVTTVVQQVLQTHSSLKGRLAEIDKQTSQVNKMEEDIDQCEEREKDVRKRLEQLTPEFERSERMDSQLQELDKQIGVREEELRTRGVELTALQKLRTKRAKELADQLKTINSLLRRLETDNGQTEALSAELEQETRLLGTQVAAVDRWSRQSRSWRVHLDTQLTQLRERLSTSNISPDVAAQTEQLLLQANYLLNAGETTAPTTTMPQVST